MAFALAGAGIASKILTDALLNNPYASEADLLYLCPQLLAVLPDEYMVKAVGGTMYSEKADRGCADFSPVRRYHCCRYNRTVQSKMQSNSSLHVSTIRWTIRLSSG